MPSRNIVKQYVEGGYYHVYNRGVEKRDIFLDEQDYFVFLKHLRSYQTDEILFGTGRPRVNMSNEVQVLSYCLMPNHYHLLVHQDAINGMTEFLRRTMTAYSMYFNKRYHRRGSLFESNVKAALVSTDEYLMHVSRYIHLNPAGIGHNAFSYQFSSLNAYLLGESAWLSVKPILDLFDSREEYGRFVADKILDSKDIIGSISLD